jgi:hypothetical protein
LKRKEHGTADKQQNFYVYTVTLKRKKTGGQKDYQKKITKKRLPK